MVDLDEPYSYFNSKEDLSLAIKYMKKIGMITNAVTTVYILY